MAKELGEQVVTVERALGERMINIALLVLYSWLHKFGENSPYWQDYNAIRTQYDETFKLWLTADEEQIEERLNELTHDTYELFDRMYADYRVLVSAGPKPPASFRRESLQSVMQYFLQNFRFRDEDFEWLREAMNDENQMIAAMLALSCIAITMRECFSTEGMMVLIDGMNSDSELISNHCTASVLKLLMQYDMRMDFFPQIQQAFVDAIVAMDDQGERVVNVLCAVIEMNKLHNEREHMKELDSIDDVPKAFERLLEATSDEDYRNAIIQWYPTSEVEFVDHLVTILPETWVYDVLTNDNPSIEDALTRVLLKNGYREPLWRHPEIAEKIYRDKLRKKSKEPMDYINYGHCLLLKGDRMMAYETYRQGRALCKSANAFYELFRPDRALLIDKGLPPEDVYLMEDKLLAV